MPLISSFGLLNALNFGLDANKEGGGGIVSNKTLIVAHNVSPYITAYPFDGGFGAKYTNPASIPTATGGQANSVTFNTAGNLVAVAYSGSPHVSVYNWTAGVGFGSVFSQPATLPTGDGMGVDFNTASNYITISHTTAPYISTYNWSGGFGSKVANPSTGLTSTGNSVAFSPTNNLIVVAMDLTPFVAAYPFSGGSYGTRHANPSNAPTNTGNSVSFNNVKTTIPYQVAVGFSGTPNLRVWPVDIYGFATPYADPATLPYPHVYSVAFNSTGTNLVTTCYGGARIAAYPWSDDFGTKYADPSTALPADFTTASAFNAAGNAVAVGSGASPFVIAYSFTSGVGFGAKLADPTIIPTGRGRSIAFSP